MRCYANQLSGSLAKGLTPFYLVFGEEPFQQGECVLAIRNAAKQQGFDEVIKFSLLPGFDWQELSAQYNSMSLFSARTLIEFDFNEQKVPTQGVAVLKSLAEQVNPDVIVIFKGLSAGQDIQRTAWFKAIEAKGLFVPCYALTGRHLERWFDDECKRLKLTISPQAKRALLVATEGNLLATHQELEKLSLLFGKSSVDEQQILSGLLNQSKFDIFDLNTGLLNGNSKQIIKVLNKLASDNVEPASILWTLQNQARTLLGVKSLWQAGTALPEAFKKYNVWKNQQALTQRALDRLTIEQIKQLLSLMADFDSAYKEARITAPYQALAHIALAFATPLIIPLPISQSEHL
ncbi:DNA polymerase III subunit delta [Pseudoalteromonas peptidolytica]|uniref:DNA polymerase III subunit delta n=1 Tax=Pseudoalteromonas peptidolytica TaxID=61150 RepID=UPI00298E6087|nr:DNA polymerase III subunit delta [Pseudoalteromonas peptidolytica]MDW7547622.1 DNA polymerase III subunit delta [Pseudoalteromonas peptidolytica]